MPKIVDVEVLKIASPDAAKDDTSFDGVFVSRPTDIFYPKWKLGDFIKITAGATVVKITDENGNYGYGFSGLYRSCASIVEEFFKPLLIGAEANEIEKLWDVMYCSSMAYGRMGIVMLAISAVDIALWDLFGKTTGLPVYQLLGGKVRDKIKCYATGSDLERYRDLGYKANKIPIPYGPHQGKWGMKENMKRVENVKKIMGDDTEIMFDCWMAWDPEYCAKMLKLVKGYNVRWIEEPVIADDYDGYRRCHDICNENGILLTGGEHEYTRWGVKKFLDMQCVDILQCDVGYTGGISEMRKIIAYAKARNVMVIPHAHSLPTFHLSISSLQSPFAETLLIGDLRGRLFKGEPPVIDGTITLSDAPGFGYELNEEYGTRLEF